MIDRSFSETDLRKMLENATAFRQDIVEGRCAVEARHARKRWEIIVEPDDDARLLVVVTAYPLESREA